MPTRGNLRITFYERKKHEFCVHLCECQSTAIYHSCIHEKMKNRLLTDFDGESKVTFALLTVFA